MEITPIAIADKMFSAATELEKSDAALVVAVKAMNVAEAEYDKVVAVWTLRMQAGQEVTFEGVTTKVNVTNQPKIAHALALAQFIEFQAKKAEVQRIRQKIERLDRIISACQSINRNLSHIVD